MLAFCYDEYHVNTRKQSLVLELAKKRFKEKAPKTEHDVKTYADRYAYQFTPPLPKRVDRSP
jgi:hypothetical protein